MGNEAEASTSPSIIWWVLPRQAEASAALIRDTSSNGLSTSTSWRVFQTLFSEGGDEEIGL
jgi:hypothetical protein